MPTVAIRTPLQRYQVMEPLGAGGQGTTFRGIDRESGRNVAIKVLSLKGSTGWKSFDLFEREVATLKTLRHPGIPGYLDDFASESTGDFFLVMELIEGTSLRVALTEDRPRLPTPRALFGQALDILQYLHSLDPSVIHRDLKPDNLLVRPNGQLVLVDFGGVRRALPAQSRSTVVGTFGYMAPEQLHGEATPATDIYGLGATMLAILTGVAADVLEHDGLRFDFSRLKLPPPFARVLPRMLEPDPGDRLSSVAEVRAVLRARPQTASTSPSTSGSTSRSTPGSNTGSTSARPSQPAADTAALVKMPEAAVALAQTPAPISVLVWILASLASGGLLVFEAVFLPFFFQLVTALQNRARDDPRRREFEADYARFKGSVDRSRRAASHVADGTRPRT